MLPVCDMVRSFKFYMPSVQETIRAIELAENVRHFVREKLAEEGMVL